VLKSVTSDAVCVCEVLALPVNSVSILLALPNYVALVPESLITLCKVASPTCVSNVEPSTDTSRPSTVPVIIRLLEIVTSLSNLIAFLTFKNAIKFDIL
jgi:hypothetical protein